MTRYLIDTNIFLFSLHDNDLLSKKVKGILEDYSSRIYISSESVKEVLHLLQSGKLRSKHWKSAEDVIGFIKKETAFGIKYIGEEHLQKLAKLPFYKDHKDPFDRMIIAHALAEKITLISSDTKFPRYVKYGLDLIQND